MKAVFKKLIIMGVIMATLMSLLLGCDAVDKNATEPVLTHLSEKYGKSFTIYALGNRIGNDTATAYVYANEDPTMLFTARVKDTGEVVFENYAYRTVCRNAENMVIEAFAKQGMDVVCFCRFSPLNNTIEPDIEPLVFIQSTHPETFGITLVIRDAENVSAENIVPIYQQLQNELDNVFIGTGIYVVSSEDFDRVSEKVMLETQTFDAYRLSLKGTEDPIKQSKFQLTNGMPSKSLAEIQAELEKEGT